MTRTTTSAAAVLAGAILVACSGSSGSSFGSGNGSGNGGALGNGSGGVLGNGSGAIGSGAQPGQVTLDEGGTATIEAVVRDFRFYSASDSSTNPDFENPPYTKDANGNPVSNYTGPWDDRVIVADALGADGKPAYRNPNGTTLTTHGEKSFAQWYNDVQGTNIQVIYPLRLTQNSDGSFGYDSNVSGRPYDVAGMSGDGFFPIDDGTPYQTAFGDQGEPHNYSFTVEIHTQFQYNGGERFDFRGDDDVFVFINGQLVINLGGIHGPETASVMIDQLQLTKGTIYPLDFFSAERHITGSNIEFTTTLHLEPLPPPK